jgi:penicillin-binding protein 1B
MVETRSMIYTEYFVKGTQPSTVCPLHEDSSFIDALAGVFGKDRNPAPVPVDAAGLPAASVGKSTTGAPAPASAAPAPPPEKAVEKPEEPKKRGFWSRIFGGGRDRDKDKKEEEEQKKREEERRKSGIR